MSTTNERWLSVVDAFQSAAIDPAGWYPALEGLAEVTGSRAGELICVGGDGHVPINILTQVDPRLVEDFIACNGGDPRVNPRVAAGMRAPVLKVLAESDFLTPEEHARHPHYDEFARPWDIPFICLATLERSTDMLVGLAVCRSQQQGHISSGQREVFASIAPHVRAAVRTQMALENGGAALLAGAMEALSIPAFVCDRSGGVRALTPAAEALVRSNRGLGLRLNRLCADNAIESQALDEAVAAAAVGHTRPGPPVQRTVVIRGGTTNGAPLVLDVIALPRRPFEFNFVPRVLIVARGSRADAERKSQILRMAYALTTAETEIAMQLAAGKTPEAIAEARSVAVGTVRAQIKAVLSKLGVRRQVELVARLSEI
ncbi:MAG TPA: helix-turn-helix transcriptional regulator [Povalibacter sp.]|nr:helix-turn-helix transcriptional regulator [Povalibacter sp.]